MIVNTNNTPRIEIGLPWTMNPELYDIKEDKLPVQKYKNDTYFTKYRYINKIFANLHPVDIIPVIPKLYVNKDELPDTSKSSLPNIVQKAAQAILTKYKPDYKTGREIFNYYIKDAFKIIDPNKYKDEIHYVRIYTTDNTQISESIQSDYEMIELGQLINQKLQNLDEALLSKIPGIGTLYKAYKYAHEAMYLYNTKAIKGEVSLVSLLKMLTDSKQLKIDFPKRWVQTNYNRIFNLTLELSSPYGEPKAVYHWVIQPLLVLITLAAPSNMYGLIGMPLYVRVKAHGLFEIPLGAISSIIIDRGGQNTKYNIHKQPLKLNVTLSIIDLYNQFSLDGFLAKNFNFDSEKVTTETSDIEKYNPEKNTPITSQPTFTNLTKSFRPVKDSSYEPKSSYIKSYTITIKKGNNKK